MSDDLRDLLVSTWRLCAFDIANSNGDATVTLRSGVQLSGKVDKGLSGRDVLHLRTERGWHAIDYAEVAAITGEAERRW